MFSTISWLSVTNDLHSPLWLWGLFAAQGSDFDSEGTAWTTWIQHYICTRVFAIQESKWSYSIFVRKIYQQVDHTAKLAYTFSGITPGQIVFDDIYKNWIIKSMIEPKCVLQLESDAKFPIGRYQWTLSENCPGSTESLNLSFSICYPNLFSCDSGDCIDLRSVVPMPAKDVY